MESYSLHQQSRNDFDLKKLSKFMWSKISTLFPTSTLLASTDYNLFVATLIHVSFEMLDF